MKPKRRKISPHEPDQPIAGIVEAIQDSDEMLRVWAKKKPQIAEVLPQSRQSIAEAQVGTTVVERQKSSPEVTASPMKNPCGKKK